MPLLHAPLKCSALEARCSAAEDDAVEALEKTRWPDGLHPDTLCFTVDVEWASPPVLADIVGLFDTYGVRATFFATHAGVDVGAHERGLHPNFRRNGDTYRSLLARSAEEALTDAAVQDHIVASTLAFAPEAKGLRAHSLDYDSTLMPVYARHGLQYDCSYQMPFYAGLRPFWKQHGILEIPTYFADHFDIIAGATGFDIAGLGIDRPGLKVLDFHPNIIYLNARDDAEYMATKAFYHDPQRLLEARWTGKGARTLLMDLLEDVAARRRPTATAGEINAAWRTMAMTWS